MTAQEKLRVAYVIQEYPQISQTYVHEEVSALKKDYEIKIFTWKKPNLARENSHPFEYIPDLNTLAAHVQGYKPHVMHSHYLHHINFLESLARKLMVPYTIRSHSFDVLKPSQEKLQQLCTLAQSPWCLRVLCFPDFKPRLIACGMPEDKVVPCWPVVNYGFFYSPEKRPVQHRIMNVGAALDKKNYQGFIDLAARMHSSGNEFNLYVMGYEEDKLIEVNNQKGQPVKTITSVPYEKMPSVYQAHDWLVYTGDPEINTIGMPMAVAEAQASGIGVCLQEMPGRRDALQEYLGGAGYLFKTIEELPGVLSQPYPEEMRLKGLENAKKCDIAQHKVLLTKVWDRLQRKGSQ